MLVSDLYAKQGPFTGLDVFIVGSGPSLTVIPQDFLIGRTCILLNDTCRHTPKLGPIAFANSLDHFKFMSPTITHKIVKGRNRFKPNVERTDNHCSWQDDSHYVFSYREPVIQTPTGPVMTGDTVSHFEDAALWAEPNFYFNVEGGSVSIFACQFAIHAGARSILLVGCDCGTLGEQHYISGKKDHQSRHDYEQYTKGLKVMQREAHKRGIPLMSLQPFVGVGDYDGQFRDLQKWQRTHPFGVA